jgi:hypothetical protein
MEEPHAPPAAMDQDEIRRLQRVNRRAWGAALTGTGIVLVVFMLAGLLFLLWLLSALEGSKTVS